MEIEIMDDEKQIQLAEKKEIQAETTSLLALAIQSDIDTERLKQLIDLKNAEEMRVYQQAFNKHFSEMQTEFEPIGRSKQGYKFQYATLSEMLKKYGPIIAKHGFSYRWRETAIDGGGKRVTIIISGHGYTDDSTYFDIPMIEATNQQNSIQAAGAMSTYGQRYTFKAGFGIAEIDEDTDGNFEEGVIYANQIKALRACRTHDELFSLWKDNIYKDLQQSRDREGLRILKHEYEKLLEQFNGKK